MCWVEVAGGGSIWDAKRVMILWMVKGKGREGGLCYADDGYGVSGWKEKNDMIVF